MTGIFARISERPIQTDEVYRAVEAADCGAVVMFSGVVRDHDHGRAVTGLEYQAHPQAQKFLVQIVREIQAETGLPLAAWHRVGSLQIGDAALMVAAAAAHRPEAFAAAERLVQRIKADVPIWKRQSYDTGESDWVGL